MIVRNFHLVLAAQLVCLAICQNARSYDTSDWIPVTQKSREETVPKRASGRVLNLDAPAQKFFPEDEYLHKKRRPNSQHHIKQKERYTPPKYENGYKFEGVQQIQQNGIPIQYLANQEVKLPNYEQPPPLDPYRPPPRPSFVQNAQPAVPNTREKAPSPNAPNLYEQYNIPVNASSLYQSLNPGSINRELLGALQYQQNIEGVGNIQNTQQASSGSILKKPSNQKGEVQLVYVPLESLRPNQPVSQDSQTIYRQIDPQSYENLIPKQHVRLEAIENDFVQQALQAQRLQQQIQQGQPILLQPTTTTPTPTTTKKRKAHQPPLSVYIEGFKQAEVADVLDVLKDAKSIAVQDSIQADSPQIFIGPSSLNPPDGYTKFPLPYLNNLNGNRVERKIDQLPFFVAPLSFKTPPGFSKIPLPSPHVGSVVISNKEDLHGKRSTPKHNQIPQYGDGQVTHSALVENVTPQTYFGQSFYDQGHSLAPRPEMLHFTIDNVGNYRIPSTTYSPESFFTEYNSNFRGSSKGARDEYELGGGLSSKAHIASTVRYSTEQENEIGSTTASSIDGQQFPAYVQQVRTPSRTKSYSTHYFDDSLSDIPSRSQQDYQISSRPADHENKIKHSSKSNHKSRYEPFSTNLDINYKSQVSDTHDIVKKVTSPSPIQQVSDVYADSGRSTPKIPEINPLELAINEFELYQINNQFQEKPKIKNQYNYDSQFESNTRNQNQDNRDYYQQTKTESPEYKFDPELHRFASTPASILRDSHVETTVRPTVKSRRRGRPTKPTTTTTTTTPSPERDTYTVLEDFTARQPLTSEYPRETEHYRAPEKSEYSRDSEYSRARQPSTSDYTRETEHYRATKKSKTSEYSKEPEYSRTSGFTARQPSTSAYSRESGHSRAPEQSIISEYSSQPEYSGVPEFSSRQQSSPGYSREIGHSRTPEQSGSPGYYSKEFSRAPGVQYTTEIEEIPARVRVLSTTPSSENVEEIQEQKSTTPRYQSERTEIEDIPARVYSLNVNDNTQYSTGVAIQNQHLDQNLMDQQILHGTIRQEAPQYETDSKPQQYYEQEGLQPIVHNRGQSSEYVDSSNENKSPGYDSSLEDPSVRSLLSPHLLVPTTTDGSSYSAPQYLPTTEQVPATTTTTTTTERYVETTTRGRGRGRQRGGSRYDSQTSRRTVSRRRPTHAQRTTTESPRYSAEAGDIKKVNSRQRFRTRGRVTPNTITERLSTTENEIHNGPTSEPAVEIITHSSEPQSYEYDHSTKPNTDINENHHKTDSPYRRPVVQYENTATTSSPIVDYRVAHQKVNQYENSVDEDSQQQRVETPSDVVYRKEETPRETVRVRGRIRGRPKPTIITSTEAATTRRTTTQKQSAPEEEEEFYGFFRQPNFSSSPAYLGEDVATTTTERPRFQHDTYQSGSGFPSRPPLENHRLQFDNTNFDSTTLRFVGEIVPKYQTTSRNVQIEPETEAPRPRIRSRIKSPQRSIQRGSYEESRPQEQATRRSNVIRSRGRTHFRLPDGLKKEKDEDEVEGGNYPSAFFQNKQQFTTRAPSFQITVDPSEEEADQHPHPSLYRPNVVRPEEWHEASQYDASDRGQTSGNTIQNANDQQEENAQVTTTPQPFALPIKASNEEATTMTSEETFRESTRAMEEIFQSINNNFDEVEETTKKQKRRRKGVWRLVKQRPVDQFAVEESQNYYSVLNSYQEIQRVDPKAKLHHHEKNTDTFQSNQSSMDLVEESKNEEVDYNTDTSQSNQSSKDLVEESKNEDLDYATAEPGREETPTDASMYDRNTQQTTEAEEAVATTLMPTETSSVSTTPAPSKESFFDTIYEMFGMSNTDETSESTTGRFEAEEGETTTSSTTNVFPTFPEEITEVPETTNAHNVTETIVDTTTDEDIQTTTKPVSNTSNFDVEPWKMRAVRTSTSTEVSHETEICYKGKCVKSRDRKKKA